MNAPRITTNCCASKNDKADKDIKAVTVSAAAINQSSEVTSVLQIIRVSKQNDCDMRNTFAVFNSGSTVFSSIKT